MRLDLERRRANLPRPKRLDKLWAEIAR